MRPADSALESAWVRHLVGGGTTPWTAFRAAAGAVEDSPRAEAVPGAQHLELLRRLNETGGVSAAVTAEVLHASLPGRGKPELRLPGSQPPRWGFPPMDPSKIPAGDLLRVVTGVLAARLGQAEIAPQPARPPRRWARQYELAGDPWARAQYAAALRADGRLPGGAAAHVVLLAQPFDQLLAAHWGWRAHREPITSWTHWLHQLRAHRGLPARLDLATRAARAAQRVGRRRVHVVFDPAAVPGLVGMRRLPVATAPPSAATLDLARHVTTALVVRTQTERRHALMWQVFRPLTADLGGAALQVPAELLPWVQQQASQMARQLNEAGYPVHGDLDTLIPTSAGTSGAEAEVSDENTVAQGMKLLRQLSAADNATTTDIGE